MMKKILFVLTAILLTMTAGARTTVWSGEKVFGSSWSAWEQIAASAFENAQQDKLLRFNFKDVGAGAQFKVSTSAWGNMPDAAEVVNIEGVYQQYTITADMLTELQSGGCIVSGTNFTLTSIETIDPAELKPLTMTVPVTGGDWVFENENPTFTIQATNPYGEAITANAVIVITTDKIAPVTTLSKSVEIAAGATENIELSWTEGVYAGFFKATCYVNDDLARAFFFGVNPTEIVSAPDKQADFDTYWNTAKTQLDGIAINATLTELNGENGTASMSTAARKVYLVEMQSIPDGLSGDPVTIRGYYAEPTDGKKHPVIMHYLGYDSGYRPGGQDVTPYCPSGDANPGYAELYISCRGQSVNNRKADERVADGKGDFTNTYGDWFAFNFGNKDSYYYRGAYMDCVRAIQFMASRTTSDMDNLYAEGQSQGGAFTVAAAALSGYTFKAIAPAITFMGDFPDYFQIVNWPAYVAKENQGTMTDEEMYAFLSYFDTKNLATNISCPYITSIGVQDNVCPPHTNIAPYNNCTTPAADKQVVYNAELQHQVNGDWYNTYMTFFENYKTTEDVELIWEPNVSNPQQSNEWNKWVNVGYNYRGELANIRMNDIIRVTLSFTDENTGTIKIANPSGWAAYSDAAEDNSLPASTTTFEYTITSAAVMENIQTIGAIVISSLNVDITKVELVKAADRYNACAVTIGADGMATWSSSKKLDFAGTGVTPYYASAVDKGTVTLTSTTTTWDYQGYVVKGAAGTYTVPVTDAAEYPSTNYLVATSDGSANVFRSAYSDYTFTEGDFWYATEDDKAEKINKIKTMYRYIFSKKNDVIGFYKLNTEFSLGAHKAYLETTTDITPTDPSARVLLVFDDEETTGVSEELRVKSEKFATAPYYNLAGQQVAQPTKGLYIVNGKKVVIK